MIQPSSCFVHRTEETADDGLNEIRKGDYLHLLDRLLALYFSFYVYVPYQSFTRGNIVGDCHEVSDTRMGKMYFSAFFHPVGAGSGIMVSLISE